MQGRCHRLLVQRALVAFVRGSGQVEALCTPVLAQVWATSQVESEEPAAWPCPQGDQGLVEWEDALGTPRGLLLSPARLQPVRRPAHGLWVRGEGHCWPVFCSRGRSCSGRVGWTGVGSLGERSLQTRLRDRQAGEVSRVLMWSVLKVGRVLGHSVRLRLPKPRGFTLWAGVCTEEVALVAGGREWRGVWPPQVPCPAQTWDPVGPCCEDDRGPARPGCVWPGSAPVTCGAEHWLLLCR